MIPLATSTAITSAAGAATVDVAPPSYTTWLVQRIEVETEQQAATEQAPEVRVYRSVVHPQMQLASTYQGIRNACEPDAVIGSAEHLLIVWSAAIPARRVTVRIFGQARYG